MAFLIAEGCCNDATCVDVCPVDCIRPRPGDPDFMSAEQLYIDAESCIDCAACLTDCPVGAVYDENDLPEHLADYVDINAAYFRARPLDDEDPPARVRYRLPEELPTLRVAVVGAGPAACYAVEELSEIKGVQISVFDRLPTPFGLIRAGVAPDHESTKQIAARFEKVLSRKNVRCYFNTQVGRQVSMDALRERHHAVILACGADGDRRLGVPGEDLLGSHSAREFVAWYNGHPDQAHASFDLSQPRVVVIGNGNVAVDVARVLASPPEELEGTDIADHALAELRRSQVREVVVVARRGPESAACSGAELAALTRSTGIDVLARIEGELPDEDEPLLRRRSELFAQAARRVPHPDHRRVVFEFGLTPVAIEGSDAAEAVTFCSTSGPDGSTEVTRRIQTPLVLRAAGFQAASAGGLAVDEHSGTVANRDGRILARDTGETLTGVYCTGWIKRGASGTIGTNRACAAQTVASLMADVSAGVLDSPRISGDIGDLVPDAVDYAGWQRIARAERDRGAGERPRVKFVRIEEMLAVSRGVEQK